MNLAAGQRGLTLIEVLVALVVMAVLSLMTWGSLDSLQRTQGDLEERSMRIQAVLAVLEQFERDVQWRAGTEFSEQGWLFPPVATEAGGAAQTPAPLFLPPSVLLQRRGADGWVLEMVRAVDGRPGYWQRVQWWQGSDGLYRIAGAAGTRYPLPEPGLQDAGRVLADSLRWRLRAWEPGAGWQTLPVKDGTMQRQPAVALELEIELDTRGQEREKVSSVVSLR